MGDTCYPECGIPYPYFHVIASEAKQSHGCFFPPRLLWHCVPRNDKREGNIDDLLNLEKEGRVTKVVDEYNVLTMLKQRATLLFIPCPLSH